MVSSFLANLLAVFSSLMEIALIHELSACFLPCNNVSLYRFFSVSKFLLCSLTLVLVLERLIIGSFGLSRSIA
jgi:hypothetical protein